MNIVFYKDAKKMQDLQSQSVDLIITSPPYFNIKNYSLDGNQKTSHSLINKNDVSNTNDYKKYIKNILKVWKQCYRVLKPNGKLCINVPLMPILKSKLNLNHNRHLFDLQSDIQNSILKNTKFNLLDIYVWQRTNSTKKLIFGSYPYPTNFYAQNIIEFISIYVKDGKPKNNIDKKIKELSKLTQSEWIEYTSQIWKIPIPNKNDLAFGSHCALMPEEIPKRLIKLFSFVGDLVLDPFAGSGTTLKVAFENGRKFVGYEIYKEYKNLINDKITIAKKNINKQLLKYVET